VALAEGSLVGTIVWVRPSEDEDVAYYRLPHVAHFGQFGVDPDHRHQGVGGRLLAQVEGQARSGGFLELALDTSEYAHHLIALYERLGFAIVDRHDWRPNVNYPSVIMAKPL
jgi:GNAT superfamily N-acetyltransferase